MCASDVRKINTYLLRASQTQEVVELIDGEKDVIVVPGVGEGKYVCFPLKAPSSLSA